MFRIFFDSEALSNDEGWNKLEDPGAGTTRQQRFRHRQQRLFLRQKRLWLANVDAETLDVRLFKVYGFVDDSSRARRRRQSPREFPQIGAR
jgi:hypothetical protein